MALEIHFQGGPQAGQVVKFGDDVPQVIIGRDPAHCQVVLPADQTKVGREHCSLRRELGRYRLVLNKQDQVLVNGKHVLDGHELGPTADLQLGVGGPVLVVKTSLAEGFAPTMDQGHQRGLTSIERDTERSAKRGLWLAVAGVAVACIALLAYMKLRPAIDTLSEQQKQMLADVEKQIAAQQSDEQRLQAALDKAAGSVYVVLERDPSGRLSPSATAWVIDQAGGVLATNGHVGKELDEATKAGNQLIARSTENPPHDFLIKSVKIHPGFDASGALWLNVLPERRTGALQGEEMSAPGGNFCDVALMYVDKPAGLAAALTLADDATLRAIQPGYLAGLVGFPMENIALGGVNVEHPTPTTQLGHVTAMTDYFGVSTGDVAQRLLVQHSIPTAGGASGSPILNAKGEVVAINNAGNYYSVPKDVVATGRIGSTAQIQYAQRADLFRELLENRADAAQTNRSAEWKTDIDQYFQPAEKLAQDVIAARAQQIDQLFAAFNLENKTNLRLDAMDSYAVHDVKLLTDVTGSLTDEQKDNDGKGTGTFTAVETIKFVGTGYLYVGAIANTAPSLDLTVGQTVDGKFQEITTDAMQYAGPWFPFRKFKVNIVNGIELQAIVTGKPAAGHDDQKKFTLRAYLFPTSDFWTPDMPAAARTAGMAEQWVHAHLGWLSVGWQPKQVTSGNGVIDELKIGTLTLTSASVPLKLTGGNLAGQEYLVVANSAQGEKIGLSVSRDSDAKVLGSDLATDPAKANPWAKCSISADEGTAISATVTGPKGAAVSISVYTAGPPASDGKTPKPAISQSNATAAR